MENKEDNTGVENTLQKHASFEFEQWKKDHPEGFIIVKRAMEDYSNQQNAALLKENAELRTVKAQWIGVMEDNASLLAQIEYMNKDAKQSHDKIMELEFHLKKLIPIAEAYIKEHACSETWESAIDNAKLLTDGK